MLLLSPFSLLAGPKLAKALQEQGAKAATQRHLNVGVPGANLPVLSCVHTWCVHILSSEGRRHQGRPCTSDGSRVYRKPHEKHVRPEDISEIRSTLLGSLSEGKGVLRFGGIDQGSLIFLHLSILNRFCVQRYPQPPLPPHPQKCEFVCSHRCKAHDLLRPSLPALPDLVCNRTETNTVAVPTCQRCPDNAPSLTI